MKVREVMEVLAKMDAEAEVCVSVSNCVSAFGAEPVAYVGRGFDWTAGKVMLEPKTRLHRLHKQCQQCALCGTQLGERVATRIWRNPDGETYTLAIRLDGKQKASVCIPKTTTQTKGQNQ